MLTRAKDSMGQWFHANVVYPSIVRARGERSVFPALDEMRRVERLPTAELLRRQDEKLARLLKHAAAHSAYYRERWPKLTGVDATSARSTLEQLPFVTKYDLQHHQAEMVCEPQTQRTTRKTTGGSTGQAVTVLKGRDALGHEMAASWLGYGWFGIRRGDRAVRFWGSPFTAQRRLRFAAADFAMHRIRFSAFAFDDQDLERYWKRCVQFRPHWFYGYTSMIEAFADFVRERGLDAGKLGLKAVVTTSEVLAEPQRLAISRAFGVPVQNEYGCGEVGPIAYSCEHGRLHEMSENILVELLTPEGMHAKPGETGEVVVTDLNNHAMPLVRYRLGDFAIRADGCECGRGFPALEKIWGREYDSVETPDGRRYHGEFFMYLFEDLRSQGFGVDQFQVLQTGSRDLEVRVVAGQPVRDETISRIERHLTSRLDGIKAAVVQVPSIERASSGKMRLVINDWLRQQRAG